MLKKRRVKVSRCYLYKVGPTQLLKNAVWDFFGGEHVRLAQQTRTVTHQHRYLDKMTCKNVNYISFALLKDQFVPTQVKTLLCKAYAQCESEHKTLKSNFIVLTTQMQRTELNQAPQQFIQGYLALL